jgi:folate-binding protein YgfZ
MLHTDWQSVAMTLHPDPAPHGVVWLPEYGVSTFEGPDATRFLQGYLTCDVAALRADRAQPTALCNIKGRVVVTGWAVGQAPDRVQLLHDRSLSAVLRELLAVYLRFSKTRLIDQSDSLLVFGALDMPDLPGAARADARRQWLLEASIDAARARVESANAITVAAWQRALIADGIAVVTAPTRDQCLPQMLDLPRIGAVSFDKGCYLGQEIVARAQHRGQVKRHLSRLTWSGAAVPAAGTALQDDDGHARGVLLQAAQDAVTEDAVAEDAVTRVPAGAGSAVPARTGIALAVLQDDCAASLTGADCRFQTAGGQDFSSGR